jgi:hypothetical protein
MQIRVQMRTFRNAVVMLILRDYFTVSLILHKFLIFAVRSGIAYFPSSLSEQRDDTSDDFECTNRIDHAFLKLEGIFYPEEF